MDDASESPKPAARIVGGPARTASYTLQWPIEYDGKLYEQITVRRLTAKEVDTFVQEVRAGNTDARLPMFDCPDEVLDAMDADDSAALNEASVPFVPTALRADSAPGSVKSDTSQDSLPST